MSKISTIYSAIVSEMETLFSDKSRIPNPYDIESNPQLPRDAWGFRVGDANQVTLEHCNFSIDRTYTIILLRRFTRIEAKPDSFDQTSKDLLEDANLVLNLFLNSEELQSSDSIEKIDLSGSSGIQSLSNSDESFLYIELSFNILISESYT